MVWAIGNPAQNIALKELIHGQSSDRVVGIVGGAILEDALREAMIERFRDVTGHNADMNEKLFRVGGPLGFFMPKIDLGYQLHMFEKPIRNAMYGIADIRNLFAHQLDMTFDSTNSKLIEATKKLTLHEGRTHYPIPNWDSQNLGYELEPTATTQGKFFVNLKLCLIWLFGDRNRHHPNCNIPITWGPMQFASPNTPPEPSKPHQQ
jgi:hypothetical protein